MGITRALAELTVQVTDSQIREPARVAAKRAILDSLGTGLAGWREDGVKPVLEQMRYWGGRGEATVLTYGDALPAPNAAFVNSVMVHALDFDDIHSESNLHIMSSVLPVSLAVAEMRGCSGRDLIAAVTLGVEVAARIGVPASEARMDRGFLPASTVGGFGATAAACRLLGLDADRTQHALGIFYAQTSGNRQALMDMSLTKRMQPAHAARAALWSACLAERGVTGATRALEGNEGFFRLYVKSDPPDEASIGGLRDIFEIERLWVKQFPSCGANHAATQAAVDLVKREKLKAEDIEAVDVWVGNRIMWIVGAPFELGTNPQVSAQFSLSYSVATALVNGCAGPLQYAPDTVVGDQAVRAMERKVRLHEIEGSKGKMFNDLPSTVVVTTRDGQTLTSEVHRLRGSTFNPMSYDEVAEKFRQCASYAGHWTSAQVEAFIGTVGSLEELPNVAEFAQCRLVVANLAE